MKRAIAVFSITALVMVSCSKSSCDAYGKSKSYKKMSAQKPALDNKKV